MAGVDEEAMAMGGTAGIRARRLLRLKEMDGAIRRRRERDEARVLRLAREAGVFDVYWLPQELLEVLKAFVDPRRGGRVSKLKLAEEKMAYVKKIGSEEERKLDARRKILLGSFLLARFERFPLERERMQGEILRFLDMHKDETVRARNKALLADILGERTGSPPATGAP